MSEKRKLKRRKATYYMKVVDQKTNKLTGNVRNISTSGLMINSPKRIETDMVYHLGMSLPDTLEGEIPITVRARSIWCSKNQVTDLYDAGFQLLNVSPDEQEIIANSLDSYLFRENI